MPFAYPTLMDAAPAISNVVEILKGGDIADRKAEFAQSVWTVQGVLQAELFGRQNVFGDLPEDAPNTVTEEDAVRTLEVFTSNAEGIPSFVIIAVLQFLLKRLLK